MNQPNFSGIEYSFRKKVTKRKEFFKVMDDFILLFVYLVCQRRLIDVRVLRQAFRRT
jgi:hypothetical protein